MRIYFAILYSFTKIGVISVGGGNSMLKLLEFETVEYRHWISQQEFISMVGSSFIFPGLTAVKLSALIGYKTAGIFGLVIAVFSLNLPGLIMAIIGYQWLSQHDSPTTRKIMVGVQYGALALLVAASYSIAQGVLSMYFSIPIVVCTLLFFIALTFWNVSPFWGFLGFIGICYFIVQ